MIALYVIIIGQYTMLQQQQQQQQQQQ